MSPASDRSFQRLMTDISAKEGEYAPFLLRPAARDYIWGGDLIDRRFKKGISLRPLAETWECSVHPDGPSTVASGRFSGLELREVLSDHPGFCGRLCPCGELPVLVKFIDAKQNLSVQVHPDDGYAERVENCQSGKTECWFIIDALPGAELVYGLREDLPRDELMRRCSDGSIGDCLRRIPVVQGDIVPVPAGTVHAIGAGILLAEIQQNSNLTYRLYDWGRKGADGKPRELHLSKAADVIRMPSFIPDTGRRRQVPPGTERVWNANCIAVDRINISDASCRVDRGTASWSVLLCLDGQGRIERDTDSLPIEAGRCAFIPACSSAAVLSGSGVFLAVFTPPSETF